MITYFSWWYAQEPSLLWQAVRVITKKTFYSFSVGLLIRTLFDPWKRDVLSAQNASLDVRIRIMFENLMTRLIGAIVRFFTIIAGLISTIIVFLILLAIFIVWLLLPIIIIYLLYSGFSLYFNGEI